MTNKIPCMDETETLRLLRFLAMHNRLEASESVLKSMIEPGIQEGLTNLASQVRMEMKEVWDPYSIQVEAPLAYAALRMANDVLQEALLDDLQVSRSIMKAQFDGERKALEHECRSTNAALDQHRRGRFKAEAKVKVLSERLETLSGEMRREVDDRRRARVAHQTVRCELLSLLADMKRGQPEQTLRFRTEKIINQLDYLTPLSWGPAGRYGSLT